MRHLYPQFIGSVYMNGYEKTRVLDGDSGESLCSSIAVHHVDCSAGYLVYFCTENKCFEILNGNFILQKYNSFKDKYVSVNKKEV